VLISHKSKAAGPRRNTVEYSFYSTAGKLSITSSEHLCLLICPLNSLSANIYQATDTWEGTQSKARA
jgi:hypothetical protein